MAQVLEGEARWAIEAGDCLGLLRELPSGTVDAVIADPPYCSGARTSADVRGRGGMSPSSLWRQKPMDCDQMTTTGFVWMIRELAFEVRRVLVEGGSFLCFIDWRQYPQLYGAVESTNLRIQTMVVWDKEDMSLGNGFRNQHELILHAAKGVPNIYDRAVPNVLRFKRIQGSELHPTEKPVPLLQSLVRVVTPADGLVVDPFSGSGTCGVACHKEGRRYIGAELDPDYWQTALNRMAQAERQLSLPLSEAA